MNDDQLLFYLKANCYGRKRQKSGSYLRQIAGFRESELRRRIARMRRKGVHIASSRSGYFYAETAGEVYNTIRQLKEMAEGLNASIRGLENALETFGEGGTADR